MNNKELGDKYIRLGRLLKNDKSKLKDIVEASFECGLIFTFGLTPNPTESVDIDLNEQTCNSVSTSSKPPIG